MLQCAFDKQGHHPHPFIHYLDLSKEPFQAMSITSRKDRSTDKTRKERKPNSHSSASSILSSKFCNGSITTVHSFIRVAEVQYIIRGENKGRSSKLL